MKPPFTLEQFLEVFKNYNEGVYPMQFLLYWASLFIVYLALKTITNSDKIISLILAGLWLWMGVVYHLIYFTEINKLAYLFGTFFIAQSILFVVFGVFQDRFLFQFHADKYGISGMVLIVFALIIYPTLGYALGHAYPSSPTFGLPCPTTIFTFGVLLLNQRKSTIWILIIPFVWSLIGFMAAIQFGILEDIGLILASLIATYLLIYRNKLLSK